MPEPWNPFELNTSRYGISEYISAWDFPGMINKSGTDGIRVVQVSCTAPANILWPGEIASVTLQIINRTNVDITAKAALEVVPYSLTTDPKDMFMLGIRGNGTPIGMPVEVMIPGNGYQEITITPSIPGEFGGYALILDIPGHERLLASLVIRAMKNDPQGNEYRLNMDMDNIDALKRLGSTCNRIGLCFRGGSDWDYEEYYESKAAILRDFRDAGLPICVEFGHESPVEHPMQPIGGFRTHLKYEDGKPVTSLKYPGDIAWMPDWDPAFKAFAKRLAMEFGWPKGTMNAMKLWNEPWEGNSISGWHADCPRYREIYSALCEAVEEAREEAGVRILLGGCDSSSNTLDKLFSDGKDDFLKRLDFMSIHYQGLNPASTIKAFVDRDHPYGRVRIWDTESWCANSDDRVAGTIATMYAAGHDRVVGIIGNSTVSPVVDTTVMTPEGPQHSKLVMAWSVGSAVAAVQAFIGNREFKRILFEGLPWVYEFSGMHDSAGAENPEDGTLVMVGDITPVFGADIPLYRTVRSLDKVAGIRPTVEALKGLSPDDPLRVPLETAYRVRGRMEGAYMLLPSSPGYSLFDHYGNPISPDDAGIHRISLDDKGLYLRGNGGSGDFAALKEAVANAGIHGLQPVEIKAHDMVEPLEKNPVLRVSLKNVLNRPVSGTLDLSLQNGELEYTGKVSLPPHGSIVVEARVVSCPIREDNCYGFTAELDCGADGAALHTEIMHCNVISRRNVVVDGDLGDWKGVLPQVVTTDGLSVRTMEDAAWRPYLADSGQGRRGLAKAYLAYDEEYFHFAVEVADDTPDGGTYRFETISQDEFFYPETFFSTDGREHKWPEGVRRYSYKQDPVLPAGCFPAFDNVQIAFNVLSDEEKPWYRNPPGTMPGFVSYYCTDYEYALNTVAREHGGGTELWRMRHPELPNKTFYPRQPKSPMDGPVKGGKLAIIQGPEIRTVECSIPWGEIPGVRRALDEGRTMRFTFRVNDNGNPAVLELARHRSVSNQNNNAMKVDWLEHWATEIEFGFER